MAVDDDQRVVSQEAIKAQSQLGFLKLVCENFWRFFLVFKVSREEISFLCFLKSNFERGQTGILFWVLKICEGL